MDDRELEYLHGRPRHDICTATFVLSVAHGQGATAMEDSP